MIKHFTTVRVFAGTTSTSKYNYWSYCIGVWRCTYTSNVCLLTGIRERYLRLSNFQQSINKVVLFFVDKEIVSHSLYLWVIALVAVQYPLPALYCSIMIFLNQVALSAKQVASHYVINNSCTVQQMVHICVYLLVKHWCTSDSAATQLN